MIKARNYEKFIKTKNLPMELKKIREKMTSGGHLLDSPVHLLDTAALKGPLGKPQNSVVQPRVLFPFIQSTL